MESPNSEAVFVLSLAISFVFLVTSVWLVILTVRVRKLEDREGSHGFFPNEKKAEPTEKF